MRILITGASGFLGSYILAHLNSVGIEFLTIGRSSANDVFCDLKYEVPQIGVDEMFDMVVHNAGMAHIVPKNEPQVKHFFEVNVGGTKNLLAALESLQTKPKCVVFISTVAVYGVESGLEIEETHGLMGNSPYALSKIEGEQLVKNWCKLFLVNCIILRLPLVIGEDAPGNLGAMERAIQKGYYFRLGTGSARRSMVKAEDVARLIPMLVDCDGIYNLTDGKQLRYRDFDLLLAKKYNKKIRSIPPLIGKFLALIGDVLPFFPLNSYRLAKLEQSFTVSDSKARRELQWSDYNCK